MYVKGKDMAKDLRFEKFVLITTSLMAFVLIAAQSV